MTVLKLDLIMQNHVLFNFEHQNNLPTHLQIRAVERNR